MKMQYPRVAMAARVLLALLSSVIGLQAGAAHAQGRSAAGEHLLLSVACLSTSTCVAVGERGTILASGDGGATWASRPSGTTTLLAGIACPSARLCLAAGGSGTILASADGGATWARRPSGTTSWLSGIACANTSTCVAVGERGAILASADGGATWSSRPSRSSAYLDGASCLTGGICLAVGYVGTILASADGGATWASRPSGTASGLSGIVCPGARTCLAVGGSGTILASGDGGATWSSRPSGTTNNLSGIACPGARTCLAIGGSGTILASANGGATWASRLSGTTNNLFGIACPSVRLCLAVGDAGTVFTSGDGGATWASRAGASVAPPSVAVGKGQVFLQWLRVDGGSGALVLGGTRFCATYTATDIQAPYCPTLLERSLDGGASWTDLSRVLGLLQPTARAFGPSSAIDTPAEPVLPANDGRTLYLDTISVSDNPHAGGLGATLVSRDDGLTWSGLQVGTPDTLAWGAVGLRVSPVDPSRLYALGLPYQDAPRVVTSPDQGRTWQIGARLANFNPAVYTLLPDSRQARTLYLVATGAPPALQRSDDAGATWQPVALPASTPPLTSFTLATDPRTPGLVIGRTTTAGVPLDRRYFSSDGGRTWQIGACPGDWHGACPSAAIAGAAGAASYAFLPSGIYLFHGQGPAEARLADGSALPFDPATVVDAAGRGQPGDPLYALTDERAGDVHGVIYRSLDAGAHWERLLARALPNLAPAAQTPGALYVPATGHSVAAPFVATYRRLGTLVLGYPVTEAYREGLVLTQDFEHLRLALRAGAAAVGALAPDVLFAVATRNATAYLAAIPLGIEVASPRPAPANPHRRFTATDHLVQGALLPFWQAHAAQLGPPLTEQFWSTNGDGSGRSYLMQYFADGRLELHPENKDPRYRILFGLVGRDVWGDARPAPPPA